MSFFCYLQRLVDIKTFHWYFRSVTENNVIVDQALKDFRIARFEHSEDIICKYYMSMNNPNMLCV